MSRWKSTTTIPNINLNVNQILHKADSIDDTLTYESVKKRICLCSKQGRILNPECVKWLSQNDL